MSQGFDQIPHRRGGLPGGLAVVTGAGSGIGRAIVLALADCGVSCCLVGRTLSKLQEVAQLVNQAGAESIPVALDLCDPTAGAILAERIRSFGRPIGLLVHSAAMMCLSRVQEATVAQFTQLLNVNLLAPFSLTKHLLPEICASKGQIVFVNSSLVHNPAAGTSQYAASKLGLKGFADALRQEVNAKGVRVISVYPGRTATPLQASVCDMEGRKYLPERLLQPEDVADVVIHSIALPHTAEVTEIMVRPAAKS